MPVHPLPNRLASDLKKLEESGRAKPPESVITGVIPASGRVGPRYRLAGEGDRPFLRMNSNGYLGMALRPEIIAAEESAVRDFGTGPGAVRFISGTYAPHVELERRLAAFHGRDAAITFGSAYAAVVGTLAAIARDADSRFPDGVLVVVDDSHGVGAFGAGGRGTEERTGARADVLIATLGKAFGVNGGYAAAHSAVIEYLRQTSPLYNYSNPITPAEAAAAAQALRTVDSDRGLALLARVRAAADRFRGGMRDLGYEILAGEHPIVPLMVRDTGQTAELVQFLRQHGILATGLGYPVVPKGDEEIRFQLSAEYTDADIDQALAVLADFPRHHELAEQS